MIILGGLIVLTWCERAECERKENVLNAFSHIYFLHYLEEKL